VRRPDELITGFEIPPTAGRQWFRKVGTRAAQAIAKVVVAGVRSPDGVRLAAGSVGPTVLRLWKTEAAVARDATPDEIEHALSSEIAPIDDIRSTADYRRRVAVNLVRQFCREVAAG
jgi:CO/xanthine dehydrogenase FAD-binding subunit